MQDVSKREPNILIENAEQAEHLADVLRSVAHPLRLMIIANLCQGEECVSGLAKKLKAKQSIVSQQLRVLRMQGIVSVVKKGGFSFYSLADPQLKNLISCLEKCSI
jgi:DNA-binding transcriptional ArsR family regulator